MNDFTVKRLPLPRVLAFASLNIPLAGVALPLTVYLAPLYANEVGLGLELTGLLFMLMRFWDVFTDPVMGVLVDRYPSRWGRVRHWILLSAPILALATYFAYMPSRDGVSPAYFVIAMFAFYVGFTLLQTSRAAWVPAIASDYDDRNRYFFWSEIVGITTMLCLMAMPALLPALGMTLDRFEEVAAMGWVLIVSIPVSIGLAVLFVPDRPLPGAESADKTPMNAKALWRAARNPMLGRVLVLETLVGTAVAVMASNYLFVTEYTFGLSSQLASLILMGFFAMSVVAMPFWMRFATATEKATAFRVACWVAVASYVLYFVSSHIGGFWPMLVAALLNGVAFAAPIALTRSMTADVVEAHVVESGENRSGIYFALLSVSYKIGTSLAFGLGYVLLGQLFDFHPGQENTPEAIRGQLIFFCAVPAILYLVAAVMAGRYTLGRKAQQDNALKLDPRGPMPLD